VHVPECRGAVFARAGRVADAIRAGGKPQNREGLGIAIPPTIMVRADKVIE